MPQFWTITYRDLHLGIFLTLCEGFTLTFDDADNTQLPEDLFLPLRGFLRIFLFLERSDAVGALSLFKIPQEAQGQVGPQN